MMVAEKMVELGTKKSTIRTIFEFGQKRAQEVGRENIFDFSLGNPNIPAPPFIKQAILDILDEYEPMEIHGYTVAPGDPDVRTALSKSINNRFNINISEKNLFLTAGAAAAITVTFKALCEEGDEFVAFAPFFPEYRCFVESVGGKLTVVPARIEDFQIDFDAFSRCLSPRTKAVIVNSPNNPSGVVYSLETIQKLTDLLREREKEYGHPIFLISDEPYREITYGAEVPWNPAIYDRAIVCYSYSKSLSLPGERIGWVLVPPTNPEHDRLVLAVAGAGRKLGFVCAPAIFQRVLADCVDVPSDVEAYARNRKALTEGLTRLGYEYIEPDGAFYLWVKALEPDAEAFFQKAKALDLLPVPSDSFGCPGWVRIGYCVSYETIVNSLPAFAQLMDDYLAKM